MKRVLFAVALSVVLCTSSYAKDKGGNGNHHGKNHVTNQITNTNLNQNQNLNRNTNTNTTTNSNSNQNVNYNANTNVNQATVSGLRTGDNQNSLSVNTPANPTNINFGTLPEMDIANMTHFPMDANWNTDLTIINDREVWMYFDLNMATYTPTKLNGKFMRSSAQKEFTSVRVYKNMPKGATILFKGAAFADKADLAMADCELTALAKAIELKGNGIVIIKQGFNLASRTKQKGFGIGTTGSAVERMGSLGITLPIGFMWASAMGDSSAQPWIVFAVVEVK